MVNRQHGAATLAVALGLILAITILGYAVAYTANTEQRMSWADQSHTDVLQAAEAGLLYGLDDLSHNYPDWIQADDTTFIATPSQPPSLDSSLGDSFAINVTYQVSTINDSFIHIVSNASAEHAPEISGTVSLYAKPITVLTTFGERAPPLVIDGCIPVVNGEPRILPDPSLAEPVSLMSSRNQACLDEDAFNLGTGTVQADAFDDGSLWDQLFALTPDDFQALAQQEIDAELPAEDRHYWWATADDLSGGNWVTSLGSPTRPVLLVIPGDLGCPGLGAGAKIYGLVFIEGNCGTGTPWGDVEIFGTLALGGDNGQLTGSVRLTHIANAEGNPPRLLPPLIGAVPVPGTWSDL